MKSVSDVMMIKLQAKVKRRLQLQLAHTRLRTVLLPQDSQTV